MSASSRWTSRPAGAAGAALIDLAEARAQALGLEALDLETRIELRENHATFARLGFEKVGEGRHQGYDRSTYVIMRKMIGRSTG